MNTSQASEISDEIIKISQKSIEYELKELDVSKITGHDNKNPVFLTNTVESLFKLLYIRYKYFLTEEIFPSDLKIA